MFRLMEWALYASLSPPPEGRREKTMLLIPEYVLIYGRGAVSLTDSFTMPRVKH